MSHGKLRNETNCLNCNARVFGPYCHVCGQQNRVTHESVWYLLVHFFNDITHFEGKWITSLRYLLFSPGFLSAAYIRGRRSRYMNPVRMYIFTSAFFFLIFFFLFNPRNIVSELQQLNDPVLSAAALLRDTALSRTTNAADSQLVEVNTHSLLDFARPVADSLRLQRLRKTSFDFNIFLDQNTASEIKDLKDDDSLYHTLRFNSQYGPIERFLIRKIVELRKRYGYQPALLVEVLLVKYIHTFPQILFVSLPLFALVLWLLFIRHPIVYPQHLIFTIHYFIFVFIWLLLLFGLLECSSWVPGWIESILYTGWWIIFFLYLYKAMRHFYGQSRSRTLVKYSLLLFVTSFLNILIFIIFFSYTILKV